MSDHGFASEVFWPEIKAFIVTIEMKYNLLSVSSLELNSLSLAGVWIFDDPISTLLIITSMYRKVASSITPQLVARLG